MSEINNSQGPNLNPQPAPKTPEVKEEIPQGISFQGEKTDLRFDPRASVNRAFVEKTIRAKIGDFDVKFGSKDIERVKKDLEQLYNSPSAVQKATTLYPVFCANAQRKGFKHPDATALALENYAATSEFIKNISSNN